MYRMKKVLLLTRLVVMLFCNSWSCVESRIEVMIVYIVVSPVMGMMIVLRNKKK